MKRVGFAAVLLAGCFSIPLYHWITFGLDSELFSYTLLIPFISIYLFWTSKEKPAVSTPAPRLAFGFAAVGILLLGVFWLFVRSAPGLTESDRLSVVMLSFVFFAWSVCSRFLGRSLFRAAAFPIGFFLFIVPLPQFAENAVSSFLQHSSAEAAFWMLKIFGTPVLRNHTIFTLPGITIEVAPECSGIRSSLVLILTSLLAGHFFLKQLRSKLLIVGAMVALGILRNGFRIFTLAQLCVYMGPSMIDSPIHHKGGPVFFAISMVPFLLLLWYLRKRELNATQQKSSN